MRPDNPPAFPGGELDCDDCKTPYYSGMSLRDWFAGQALIGLLAATANPNSRGPASVYSAEDLARNSYILASFMLAARLAKTEERT